MPDAALVQGRDHLPGARQVVLRQQQRRRRRLPGPDPEARLPAGPRHHLPVAAAVLPVAAARTTATTSPTTRTSTRATARSTTSSASSRAAHDRGIRVLTELVINHTSDQHPWFQRARHAPPGSPERDFYVWSDTDQKYPETPDHLHRHREVELDAGIDGRQGVLLAPLLPSPARPQPQQPGGARGGHRRDAVLARSRRRRRCGSTPCRT